MKTKDYLTYLFLKSLSKWFQNLAVYRRRLFAQRLSGFFYYRIPVRKNEALKNIQKAFPNKSPLRQINILKQCYQFFTHNFIQFLAFPRAYHNANILVRGREVLDDALRKGRGVILITGHFGAWEILAAWLGYNNYPFVGIAQRQKNRGADWFFRELRELSGVLHIYRKSTLEKMYTVLRQGHILGLVSDQDAKQRGVFVDFFGRPASTPKGAALFHLKSGAPIVFTACHEDNPNNFVIEFIPVPIPRNADTVTITQIFTTKLEAIVRQHPDQYFWFHRRWKTKENQRFEIREQRAESRERIAEKKCTRIGINHADVIQKATEIIRNGGIVVFPTDTLYGFGVDATNHKAIDRLNSIKRRSGPISVIAADVNMARSIANVTPDEWNLIKLYLRERTTAIYPVKSGFVDQSILGPDNTLGVRIPAHYFGPKLVKLLGVPVTTTSVNRTGEPPLNDPVQISDEFGDEIDLLVDSGVLPSSDGSAVYMLKGKQMEQIRPG